MRVGSLALLTAVLAGCTPVDEPVEFATTLPAGFPGSIPLVEGDIQLTEETSPGHLVVRTVVPHQLAYPEAVAAIRDAGFTEIGSATDSDSPSTSFVHGDVSLTLTETRMGDGRVQLEYSTMHWSTP